MSEQWSNEQTALHTQSYPLPIYPKSLSQIPLPSDTTPPLINSKRTARGSLTERVAAPHPDTKTDTSIPTENNSARSCSPYKMIKTAIAKLQSQQKIVRMQISETEDSSRTRLIEGFKESLRLLVERSNTYHLTSGPFIKTLVITTPVDVPSKYYYPPLLVGSSLKQVQPPRLMNMEEKKKLKKHVAQLESKEWEGRYDWIQSEKEEWRKLLIEAENSYHWATIGLSSVPKCDGAMKMKKFGESQLSIPRETSSYIPTPEALHENSIVIEECCPRIPTVFATDISNKPSPSSLLSVQTFLKSPPAASTPGLSRESSSYSCERSPQTLEVPSFTFPSNQKVVLRAQSQIVQPLDVFVQPIPKNIKILPRVTSNYPSQGLELDPKSPLKALPPIKQNIPTVDPLTSQLMNKLSLLQKALDQPTTTQDMMELEDDEEYARNKIMSSQDSHRSTIEKELKALERKQKELAEYLAMVQSQWEEKVKALMNSQTSDRTQINNYEQTQRELIKSLAEHSLETCKEVELKKQISKITQQLNEMEEMEEENRMELTKRQRIRQKYILTTFWILQEQQHEYVERHSIIQQEKLAFSQLNEVIQTWRSIALEQQAEYLLEKELATQEWISKSYLPFELEMIHGRDRLIELESECREEIKAVYRYEHAPLWNNEMEKQKAIEWSNNVKKCIECLPEFEELIRSLWVDEEYKHRVVMMSDIEMVLEEQRMIDHQRMIEWQNAWAPHWIKLDSALTSVTNRLEKEESRQRDILRDIMQARRKEVEQMEEKRVLNVRKQMEEREQQLDRELKMNKRIEKEKWEKHFNSQKTQLQKEESRSRSNIEMESDSLVMSIGNIFLPCEEAALRTTIEEQENESRTSIEDKKTSQHQIMIVTKTQRAMELKRKAQAAAYAERAIFEDEEATSRERILFAAMSGLSNIAKLMKR